MFIPFNEFIEKIYAYDVNSLYPFIMKYCLIPIGTPTYFEGDIRKYESEAFGFFYCEVETPDNLEHPIIQIHHKTTDGIRTISPLGKFNIMIFSEEMDNAIKFGYKFNIKSGYLFEKGIIFENFISDLYTIRLNYPKTDPMNYIAKIIMNSLYGRFGMTDNFDKILIINKNEFDKYSESITESIILNNKILIKIKNNDINNTLNNGSNNVNIAVASSITAYARIHMSQFKNNDNYKLFYTDTDSIYINKQLPNELVSNIELGKMKLEHVIDKAIFLAPKVYGFMTKDQEIIKIKGLKQETINKLSLCSLEELLYKNVSIDLNQEKWFKNYREGTITIKEQLYNLKITDNKRILVYNNIFNKLVNTTPITLD